MAGVGVVTSFLPAGAGVVADADSDKAGEGNVHDAVVEVAESTACCPCVIEGEPRQFISDDDDADDDEISNGGKSWGAIARCCEWAGVSSQGELRSDADDEAEEDDEETPDEDRVLMEREVDNGSTPQEVPSWNENPLKNSGSTSGNGD